MSPRKKAIDVSAGREKDPAPLFFRLTVEYDGAGFDGWQIQPGRRTVQGALEKALRQLYGARVVTNAAGRTDAGVHAAAQSVTAETPRPFKGDLRAALNAALPADVAVTAVLPLPAGARARRDVKWKTYRYALLNRPVRPALDRGRLHWIARPLDAAAMARAARAFVGKKDFAAFAGPASRGLPTICNVKTLEVARQGDRIYIDVTADRFLHHMARRLAGHLAQVGWGAPRPKPLSLPPHGLTLLGVVY